MDFPQVTWNPFFVVWACLTTGMAIYSFVFWWGMYPRIRTMEAEVERLRNKVAELESDREDGQMEFYRNNWPESPDGPYSVRVKP